MGKSMVFSGCCANFAFILDEKGHLHCVGGNRSGQLGLGSTAEDKSPTINPFFEGLPLRSVAPGDGHTLFLTDDDIVYSCGENYFGQCGHGNFFSHHTPTRIDALQGKNIAQIAGGGFTSFCVSGEGDLYAFGWNLYGQLGLGRTNRVTLPSLVKFPNDELVSRISVGFHRTAVITREQKLFILGSSEFGSEERNMRPKMMEFFSGKHIQDAFCGGYHTIIVISPSEVYVFGSNDVGQLGLGDKELAHAPTRLTFFDDHPVKSIQVGGDHTLCILESGEIFSFGWNVAGQLCTGTTCDELSPAEVSRTISTNQISEIICGYKHTLVVTLSGCCYAFGDEKLTSYPEGMLCPRLLVKKICNSPYPLFVCRNFAEYIIGEQANASNFADLTIEVTDRLTTTFLRLDSLFIKERCPEGFPDVLVVDGEFTEDVRDALLAFLYANEMAIEELSSEDLTTLRDLLTGNRICSSLLTACDTLHLVRNTDGRTKDSIMPNYSTVEKSLSLVLAKLFENKEEDGDVQISDGLHVHSAHKFVLVARRKYFRGMFSGGFLESETGDIEMGMSLGAPFEVYLRYLYTGCPGFSANDAVPIAKYNDYFCQDREEDLFIRNCCNRLLLLSELSSESDEDVDVEP